MSNERLYLLVEEKFNEAAITETSEFGYIHIMDRAIVPKKPVTPKVALDLALGAFLGSVLGIVLVLVRARMDDRIRTPEDLKKRFIVPLATIGSMELLKRKNGKNAHGDSTDARRLNAQLVAHTMPLSPISEGYRHLRTNVQYQHPDQLARTILVTSGNPKEGKTTTAANLAISYAQGESRILLIDADMRRPTVHDLFGLPRDRGLTDALTGKKTFGDVVHRRVLENLDVLTCGAIPPNPAEILSSTRMKDFVENVKATYDVVLFDSPPLLAVVDAGILSRLIDAVIIVVRSGETSMAELDRSREILRGVGKKPAGIVLNGFEMRRAYGGYHGFRPRDLYGYAQDYSGRRNGESKKLGNRTRG
jgi:capsular exopolysaccharide synthesis family protein